MSAFRVFAAAPSETAEELSCYHCHQPCPDEAIEVEGKHFCCEGCKAVYEILCANDLCAFYQIDPQAGRSLREGSVGCNDYAWLDDPDVQKQLLRFSNGRVARVSFHLPAIHCASCIWLLEHLYRLDAGVQQSRVDFLKKEVSILFDEHKTTPRRIAQTLARIGYPPDIRLRDVSASERPAEVDRSLMYKIGVAGFAFGNIMLLSFPEYLGLERERDMWFFQLFGYINLALAVPVLLYSGRDYFRSAYEGLRQRYLNIDVPLALGMAVLFGRSAWEILTGTGAGYMDSLAGLVFFLLVGRWFQQKTYHQLSFERDYRSYFPVAASRWRADGSEEAVPVQKLAVGDVIRVRHGELIPADGILVEGEGQIDYSFVTGESEPVGVSPGAHVYAGGRQVGAALSIRLTKRVDTSYLTQLWNDEAFQKGAKGHASILAERAGRYFTALILGVASLAFLYWAPQDMGIAINAFTAVLIIACPCAVALAIPFTMGNVLRLLGRNGFFVKNTQVLEAFSTINAVIFDKTGTITPSNRGVAQFVPAKGQVPLTGEERAVVRALAAQSYHPVSRQIADALGDAVSSLPVRDFVEIAGKGIQGVVGNRRVRIGSAALLFQRPAAEGGPYVEIDGIVRGRFDLRQRYREGLPEVIQFFRQRGRSVWLLSGDNDRAAEELTPLFGAASHLRFHQSPRDKLAFVQQLQSEGHRVLMLGDGLNDAGALQRSDVGIAVTEDAGAFTPACDAILDARQFSRLPQFLTLVHWGMRTVNRAYVLAACYNVVGLSFAVSGQLSPVIAAVLMPLSSVTVVLFGFVMTHGKARQMSL